MMKKIKAFTLIEILVTVLVLALMFAVLLPTMRRQREVNRAITCSGNLKTIRIAFSIWPKSSSDAYPMRVSTNEGGTLELVGTGPASVHFQVISNELMSTAELVCPADRRKPATNFTTLANTNISYFVGLDAEESNPQMLLAGDRNVTNGTALPSNRILALTTNSTLGWTHELHNRHGNIALADGSVQQMSDSQLTRQVHYGGGSNRLAIP